MQPATDSTAALWRSALLETLESHRALPLLLSGGVDSGTLLAALLALGERPICYAVRIGCRDNQDLRVARAMCRHYGLDLVVASIPEDELIEDLRALFPVVGRGKAAVQCGQPIKHLARVVESESALCGVGGVVDDNKRFAIILAQSGEEAALVKRKADLYGHRKVGSGSWAMVEAARSEGVDLILPYAEEPLASYGLSLPVSELNRPRQKGIALRAFPSFWANGWWRPNVFMQRGIGLREWHDAVLLDPTVNRWGYKSVVGVFNRL